MSYQLGPSLAARPLHFFLVLDVSGSMARAGKIDALNQAVRDALRALGDAEDDHPGVDVLVRVVAFAEEARWHVKDPTPVTSLRWSDVHAVPRGTTETGRALSLVLESLEQLSGTRRGLPPAIVLVSDGQPTDLAEPSYGAALRSLQEHPWAARSSRMAIGIGSDADLSSLQRFIGHEEVRPLVAENAAELTEYLRWASTMVIDGLTRTGALAADGAIPSAPTGPPPFTPTTPPPPPSSPPPSPPPPPPPPTVTPPPPPPPGSPSPPPPPGSPSPPPPPPPGPPGGERPTEVGENDLTW